MMEKRRGGGGDGRGGGMTGRRSTHQSPQILRGTVEEIRRETETDKINPSHTILFHFNPKVKVSGKHCHVVRDTIFFVQPVLAHQLGKEIRLIFVSGDVKYGTYFISTTNKRNWNTCKERNVSRLKSNLRLPPRL